MAWSQKSIKYEVMLVELPQQTPSAARLLIKTLCGVGSEVEKQWNSPGRGGSRHFHRSGHVCTAGAIGSSTSRVE